MPDLSDETLKNKPWGVGIGASAGGIDALRLLLPGLARSETTVYLLALHRPRQYDDELLDLLRSFSPLPVETARDAQALTPGRLYLVPGNHDATVSQRTLHLQRCVDAYTAAPSVDRLFESLAADFADCAVGVVLSGTMHDGTAGCLAIRRAGGRVLVQQPEEASQPGMGQSVIAAGAATEILPLSELAEALNRLGTAEASCRPKPRFSRDSATARSRRCASCWPSTAWRRPAPLTRPACACATCGCWLPRTTS